MDRSSRTGAALWLGGLATLVVVLVAIVLLGRGISSLYVGEPDAPSCADPPRYAEWRQAFQAAATEDNEPPGERVRRAAAAYLVKCRTLHGSSRAAVRQRLGKPLPPDSAGDRTLEYYVGPDGLMLDTETLLLSFRHGIVTRVEVIQG